MTKRNKIIYWIATIWLALGMVAGGVQQMLQIGGYNDIVTRLGYPLYLLTILGIWKILGVIAILVPGFRLVKEWAYAGFFFNLIGALYAHLAMRDPFSELIPALFLLVLTSISYFFRPAERKIVLTAQQ